MTRMLRPSSFRVSIPLLPLLLGAALFGAACGAKSEGETASASPAATAGAQGEVDDAPYVAYEQVSAARLPRERLEPAGEVRLVEQVRRVPAFRLRDGGDSAIRYTEGAERGWLAWQPLMVLRARREFASGAGAQPAQVTTLAVARVEWPDTCLGVPRTGAVCTSAATPGFRITLRLSGTTAVFHTGLREQIVRAPG